jgi:methionine-rich copper-binding protein CopC
VGIGDATLAGISTGPGDNLVGSALIPIDPRLGPLADNGGPTLTMALLADSPARGAGSLAFATATDQRGLPRTVGGEIDLGAYQSQSVASPLVVSTDPGPVVDPPVNHVRLTFNHSMNPSSLTTGQFSLSGPGGSIALTSVTAVPSTDNQQFDVSFASQSHPGDYALLIAPSVSDSHGTTFGSPVTVRFIVYGLTGCVLKVNSTADTANPTDPYLTLREAIAIVNSPTLPAGLSPQILGQISGTLHAHGSDTIVFDHTSITGPITLGGTQLELSLPSTTAWVRIDGGSGITLDANQVSRLFQVDLLARVTLDHLTLTHGNTHGPVPSSGFGGAIFNVGNLTVTNSTLTANSTAGQGGGIYNIGTLAVNQSTGSANVALEGGVVFNTYAGTATVSGCTLSSNTAAGTILFADGGALDNAGMMTVTRCTITGNSVTGRYGYGGGIYNFPLATLTITDSTLSSNTASPSGLGGGLSSDGTLTVNRCTFSSNVTSSAPRFGGGQGGGLDIDSGTATVSNSTLGANSADSGGGIYIASGGTLTVTNSTITDNSAAHAGGGVFSGGSLLLQNTLVAGNHSSVPSSGPDINGAVNSASSSNLVGYADRTLTGISDGPGGNLIGSAANPIDPRLGPLANNGGPTRTYALLADSPARGAGSLAFATTTDQRGQPRIVSGQIDIGAYQSQTAVGGPQIVVSDPNGRVNPPVNHVRLTFNHPMNPSSLTTSQFTLSGPGGSIAVTAVSAVPSTNNEQFDVSFASQTHPGDYTLVVSASLRDTSGNSLGSAFTDRFGIFSQTPAILTVNSRADTADPSDPYLTLREAIAIVNSPTLPDLSPQIRAQICGILHLGGVDTIVFDTTQMTGPINLTGTPIELSLPSSTARVVIDGGRGVTLDGHNNGTGFQVDSGVQATFDHLTISHTAPYRGSAGAINNSGTLTVTNSTLSGNSGFQGGAIDNQGTLTLANSTLQGNTADYLGGGLSNEGTLTVSNSTFSGNSCPLGGGIANSGTATITNCTLSGNSAPLGFGGGIDTFLGTLSLQNTIVAGNHSADLVSGPDIYGAVSTSNSSNNLVGIGDSNLTGISNGTAGNLIGTSLAPIDPRLGPLANNGGPTRTHALLADSPARGAGSLAYATATDQRGQPRTVGGEIDLGAYQSQTVAAPRVVVSDPCGVIDPPVNHVRFTFNHPMDPTSVTPAQFTLTGPGGSIAVTGVSAVTASNNQQFDVSFASQTSPGDYTLVVSATVRDSHGTSLGSHFTDRFIVYGLTGCVLTVNSTADTANPSDPWLTLREAIAIVNSPTLPTNLSSQILAQISGSLHAHGSDAIVFDTAHVTGPITLSGTQLELSLPGKTARVRIDGGSGVTVDGNNASRVFQVDFGVQAIFAHLTITHGSVSNSDTGAGILNNGMLTVSNSTFSGNSANDVGGAVFNAATLTVSNSTLSGNSASSGGGIENAGTLTLTNSTLAGNTVAYTGGGIDNEGTVTVSNCTISGNSAGAQGGGINQYDPTLHFVLQNTIVGGNQSGGGTDTGPDISAALDSSSSYNLVGIGDASLSGIGNGTNHNQIGSTASPLDPRLAPLGVYGGPTQTMPLLAGSPALDTGDPSQAGTPDQRGVVRSGGVNIGAFQASASAFVVTAPGSVTAGTPFTVTVAAYDSFHQLAVGYTGTATLGSSDPQAVLAGPHTFTLRDGGSFTFTGVILTTTGLQTISADDGTLHGSAAVTVVAGNAPGTGGGSAGGQTGVAISPTGTTPSADPGDLVFLLRDRDHSEQNEDPIAQRF